MDINKILQYLPTAHGEHGVDSVIHRKINKNLKLFESYCNPPGASWAEIIIKNPLTGDFYSWDHIPRNPDHAKRPDSIIQFNQDNMINLLVIESKEKISDIYKDIDVLLKNFFTGNEIFNGLFNRPTQQMRSRTDSELEYIGNDDSRDIYWIQDIKDKIKLFSGFAFGFKPEFYKEIESFNEGVWKIKMEKLRDDHSLDVVIGIGWHEDQHTPFVKIIPSAVFSKTEFFTHLKCSLS